MKNMLEICRGCFGASFNDCQECPTIKKIELDVNEMKMYTDIHKEEEYGKEEKVL